MIVPNANLISSEVINWTLSDDSHRMEISVGVAYGTDPQTVLELLVSVANDHPEVSRTPEPIALFLGFGDSSLDFELRAWTGTDFVQVASELRVAVNQALADAGIEIPFPQRDLHVRSGIEWSPAPAINSAADGQADAAESGGEQGAESADTSDEDN